MHVKSTVYRRFQIARTYPAFASKESQMLLNKLRDDLVTDLLKQPTSENNPTKKEEMPSPSPKSPAPVPNMHGRHASLLDPSNVLYALSNPEPRTSPRRNYEGN